MTSLRIYSITFVAAVAGFAWLSLGKRQKPDKEQERRLRLSRSGRLTVGTALDMQEAHDEKNNPIQLLIYRYDIAGVAYEASQDVTKLRELLAEYSGSLGLPASVKYDPQNPSNSIVISEIWNGLRK